VRLPREWRLDGWSEEPGEEDFDGQERAWNVVGWVRQTERKGFSMTYKREGDNVTIQMSQDDFSNLLLMVGYAAGAARREGDVKAFYRWIEFANDLNTGNPNFRPYEIPPEFRRKQDLPDEQVSAQEPEK
jgi:hypothetical protein